MVRLYPCRKVATVPSMTDLLSKYAVLRSLAPYLTLPDLLNLASTCKAHHEFIKGNAIRFRTLFQLGRCSGSGSAQWKSDELSTVKYALMREYPKSWPLELRWVPYVSILHGLLLRFKAFPVEVDLAMEKLLNLHNQLPCRDSIAKQEPESRLCVKCGVPVCNVCRYHRDYRAVKSLRGLEGPPRFLDELDRNDPEDNAIRNLVIRISAVGIQSVDTLQLIGGTFAWLIDMAFQCRGRRICAQCAAAIMTSDEFQADRVCNCTVEHAVSPYIKDQWWCIRCFSEEAKTIASVDSGLVMREAPRLPRGRHLEYAC